MTTTVLVYSDKRSAAKLHMRRQVKVADGAGGFTWRDDVLSVEIEPGENATEDFNNADHRFILELEGASEQPLLLIKPLAERWYDRFTGRKA